mmetsp:Transcript_6006/g.7785  ORF Transcript_6006/g.7785 Transcript_6006/m.7785 type:complete len:328 (-) Transcript_6006:457-1440(-)
MVAVEKEVVSGHPPWHMAAFVIAVVAVCIRELPTLESLDEIGNKDIFLNVIFPGYLSPLHVAYIRLTFGGIMIVDSSYHFLFGYWSQDTEYHPKSKLKPVPKVPFRGVYYSKSLFRGSLTLSYFTFWVWVLEGWTFLLTGSIPIAILTFNMELSPWIFRLAIVSWQVVGPATMLVSAVVKYVLWPLTLQNEDPTNANLLNNPVSLIEHNLNFIAAISEVALLGGLPIRYKDLAATLLFGVAYVLFSFAVMFQWTDRKYGPQFIYPFLDPTLGWLSTAFLLALLMVLTFFHVTFCWFDHFLTETLGGGLQAHVAAVGVLILLVCRFRD